VNRQLAFAGIAAIWILSLNPTHVQVKLPNGLDWALIFFVFSLSFDLLHYAISAWGTGIYHHLKREESCVEVAVPDALNLAFLVLAVLKVISTIIGYIILLASVVIILN